MKSIDIRSDTVTVPTPGMREAICNAEVGDDVHGEDPSIRRLEQMSAEIFGKEAGLFMASGTMANQVALLAHTRPGDNVVIGEGAHNYFYESGGGGALAGVLFTVVGRGGTFNASEMESGFTLPDHHFAPTTLVCVENTHNRAGGKIFPLENIEGISRMCTLWGIKTHCDGARIFNAQVATGVPVSEYARHFDSISFCLSKALGAPAGSVLLGDREFRDRAHRYRKMLGGGMRQAGFLAAAGIYALEHHVERLAEDHENAKELAKSIARNPGFEIDLEGVETNIVNVRIANDAINAFQFVFKASENGVLVSPRDMGSFRIVTHLDFQGEWIPEAVERLNKTLEQMEA